MVELVVKTVARAAVVESARAAMIENKLLVFIILLFRFLTADL
jgi:hypothetical protein